MKNKLYPLKFYPILKEKVWGGEKLNSILKKQTHSRNTGESWEISAIDESVSIVENGSLKGKTLTELLDQYQSELIGKRVFEKYGNKFPLLFKFIDADQNLSLQLHPDDELAQKRHNSFGKTEMWYILQADENSGIYVGFNQDYSKEECLTELQKGNFEEVMNFEKVKPGDFYYIKPGLVHSIGKGVLLAEIQQSSDITYRLYDWNRKDLNGKPRKLHTQLAIDAIDFEFDEFKLDYENKSNDFENIVDNVFFKTRKLNLTKNLHIDYSNTDSFVVFMCVKGGAIIHTSEQEISLNFGETILVPASLNEVQVFTESVELLEITL